MNDRKITRFGPYALAILGLLTWASAALAGGFFLTVDRPAPGQPKLKNAALVVRVSGCVRPEDASVVATAEGLVNGRRRSVPLKMTLTPDGVYAVRRQWPAEGAWLVSVTGTALGATLSALIEVGPKGQLAAGNGHSFPVEAINGKRSPKEIDTALRRLAEKAGPVTQAARVGR